MSSIQTAQNAFFKNKQNTTGPTSAAKKKRGGGKKKSPENRYLISDLDRDSMFLGIIKAPFGEFQAMITNLRDDSVFKGTARNIKMKFLSIGTPVVCSSLGGNKYDISSYYSMDYLPELCSHFKINYETASKKCGIATSISAAYDEPLPEVAIAAVDSIGKKKNRESDSNSDSLEPNPNHQPESDDSDDNDDVIISEEQREKLDSIEIDYSVPVQSKESHKQNKKNQSRMINKARDKKVYNGTGFRF